MDGCSGTWLTHPIGIFGLLGRGWGAVVGGEGDQVRRDWRVRDYAAGDRAKTCAGSAMFFSRFSPRSTNSAAIAPRTWRQASAEMQMPPGARALRGARRH